MIIIVTLFGPNLAALVYVPVPVWFQRHLEVPFGFQPNGPETVVYRGSHLKNNPLSSLWKMVMAEPAANCAVELIYRAHRRQKV